MSLEVRTPSVDDLAAVVAVLRPWQRPDLPVQLHPGDLGWNQMFGAEAVAGALRVWERDGEPVAVGLLDEDGDAVLRLALSPDVAADDEVARAMADELSGPDLLGEGEAVVEARYGDALVRALRERGWTTGEAWACFRGDLTDPVPDPGLRVEVVDESRVADRVAIQRASFPRSTFTEERWRAMAAGPAYADARCLVAYDRDTPVAMTTVWSAGPGRSGLIEPMGVSRDHQGRGFGRAITLAAAAALRGMGAAGVLVATPAANAAAVATYASVLTRLPDSPDLHRP